MVSTSAAPYRDLINRWKLVKKDPSAAISEPVEPITWWIENTTPVEFRDAIYKAAMMWNGPFEAAGFKNAVVVKIQPDDADWDAGDIRYNVLRWTSSPNPPFGGYGPSFVNPRTGQILGADIMLEYIFVTNRVRQEKAFATAAMGLEADIADGSEAAENIGKRCTIRGAILDEHCFIPDGMQIGVDPKADRERFDVTPRGIVLVTPDALHSATVVR